MSRHRYTEKRKTQVMISCTKEWRDTDAIKLIDIEEDFCGRDVATFQCPECGEYHQSIVVAR